jgi:hypothetical protein
VRLRRQKIKTALDLSRNLRRREQVDPASSEFDAQRHSFHETADADHVGQVGDGEIEVGMYALSALDEELPSRESLTLGSGITAPRTDAIVHVM